MMFFSLLSALFVLMAGSGISSATEFIVHNGESIQLAVDNATSGDTVIIEPGTYNENVTIQSAITIVSESGDPEDTTIQGSGFEVYTGGVTIKGFTLKGADESTGVFLLDSSGGCTIENNKILDYDTGIGTSIYCSSTVVNNNEISNCDTGVSIGESLDNVIGANEISNCGTGIIIDDLVSADIKNNMIIENDLGVSINGDASASIVGNNINFNSKCGLYDNAYGGSTVYNNYFNNTKNVIFDEFHQVPNIWNATKTTDKNIIGGPYLAGNCWTNPNGTGFSQLNSDASGDGIAEKPYAIDGQDIDYMPLVTPEKKPAMLIPAASFQTNISKGPAPLSVHFTDLSENAVSLSWDFENDGKIDSKGKNEVHVYTFPGSYTVNHTVNNEFGTASKLITITVSHAIADNSVNNGTASNGTGADNGRNGNNTTIGNSGSSSESGSGSSSSGSSSSGSSSSGGAGGSPESAKNVEVKELSQVFVASGKEAKFEFQRNETCVAYVSFDAKKTLGKITTIVEMLKGKSILVSELPAGEVYQSFNVWVGNGGIASTKNIENPVLRFKVEKSWLQNNSIDPALIALNWYNDLKWEQISVKTSGEDAKYLYFTANVPGYSTFAITGKAKSYPGLQDEQQEENSFGTGSVRLTSDTDDTVMKDGVKKSAPGFEMIFGIVCLLGVFLYRRK